MIKLLYFEFKKINIRRKIVFLTIFTLLFIGGLFIRNLSMQSYIKNEELENIESHLNSVYQNIDFHEIRLKTNPSSSSDAELLKESILMKENLFQLQSLSVMNDWKEKLAVEISFWNQVKSYKNEGGFFDITESELNQKLFLLEELLKKDIPLQHEVYSIASSNFIKQVFDFYANAGIYIMMLFLFGAIFTFEFEQHSIKSIFTQPIKRPKIVSVKFITSFILFMISTCIVLMIAIGAGYFFGTQGSFDYPIVIQVNNELQFVSITKYILMLLAIMSTNVILGIVFCFLYSILFKNTRLTLLLLLATFAGGFSLTKSIPALSTLTFNPFRMLLPNEAILVQDTLVWYQGLPFTLFLAFIVFAMTANKIKTIKIT